MNKMPYPGGDKGRFHVRGSGVFAVDDFPDG